MLCFFFLMSLSYILSILFTIHIVTILYIFFMKKNPTLFLVESLEWVMEWISWIVYLFLKSFLEKLLVSLHKHNVIFLARFFIILSRRKMPNTLKMGEKVVDLLELKRDFSWHDIWWIPDTLIRRKEEISMK